MASIAYSYLRLRQDNVLAEPWTIERAGRVSFIPDLLEDWDPGEPLHLRRRVRLNLDMAAAALAVPPEHLVVLASLIVGTGGPRGERQRTVREQHALSRSTPEAEFAAVLEGDELSERLTLRTLLTLGSTAPGSPLSPRLPGVELWQDVVRMALEPDEARFAIQVESFPSTFRDTPLALWRLDWSPGLLDRDMAGNVRLYVNADRPDFVDRVSGGDAATLQLMAAGIMEQLAVTFLSQDTAGEVDEAPTSIASTVRGWIDQAFPGQGIDSVKELMHRDPATFAAGVATLAVELGVRDD